MPSLPESGPRDGLPPVSGGSLQHPGLAPSAAHHTAGDNQVDN